MTRHRQHFEEFQPHTKLKHAILDAYIVTWAMKLLMWGGAGSSLAIVDAFAGQGQDNTGQPGSPVIAARRALEAMRTTRGRKPWLEEPRIRVFAIEKNRLHFRELTRVISQLDPQEANNVTLYEGELSDHIHEIRRATGRVPVLYFLDPFGIKGLDAATYPKALDGPHNELFALFSDLGATRLHGLLTAERGNATDVVDAIQSQPSLFPQEDAARIAAAEAAAVRSNDALDATRPAAREHLTRALGNTEWGPELATVPPEQRPDTFLKLFRRTLIAAGARYVLTIPMRNDAGQRVYSLVHASKSQQAYVAMKDAVTNGLQRSRLTDTAGQRMLEDMAIDLPAVVGRLRVTFAGRTLPWADHGEARGIRSYVLGATPMFPGQSSALKALLKSEQILSRKGRLEMCAFPRAI